MVVEKEVKETGVAKEVIREEKEVEKERKVKEE
jgi:hypothetical protein